MANLPEQRVIVCNDIKSGIRPEVAEGIASGAEDMGYKAVLAGSLEAAYEHASGSYHAIFVASNNLITPKRRNLSPHKAFPKPQALDVNRFMSGIALWNASIDERHGKPWAQKALKNGISLTPYKISAFLLTGAAGEVTDLPDEHIYRVPPLKGGLQFSFSAMRTRQMLAGTPVTPHLHLVSNLSSEELPVTPQDEGLLAA